MYKDFFQMKGDAFSNQPLPGLFFTSKSHQTVWNCLISAINRNEPYLLVTGAYGMGKTTLCLRLVRALKQNGRLPFLHVATPNYDYPTILQRLAVSLGLSVEGVEGALLQDRILQYLEKEQPKKGVILILDDVQDMGPATLANLRLLANFSHDGFFPFRLVLFGHPSFIRRLHSQVLQALGQRIRLRMHLEPLSLVETREYVYFRLYRAGGAGSPIFTDEAMALLGQYSRGIPRLINNVCDVCLFLAASQGVEVIDRGVMADAVRYLEAEPQRPPEPLQETWQPPPVRTVAKGRQPAGDPAPPPPEGQPAAPAIPPPAAAGVSSGQGLATEERGSPWAEEFGALDPSIDIPADRKRKGSSFAWLVVFLVVFLVSILLMIVLDVTSVLKGLM